MKASVVALEVGKNNPTNFKTNQRRRLPLRILQFLMSFAGVAFMFSVPSLYMIQYFSTHSIVPVLHSTFYPCHGEPESLERWVRPPSSLLHTMNDTQLFWRASFAPQIKEYPFSRTPKIAFMFLTRRELPLAPLWERFFAGNEGLYSIYIHSLPNYQANFSASSVFYRRQIPSQVSEWGMMSMCDAERRLLANALLDISNEWFVLLSESCIPLHHFSVVYQYLLRSQHSFIGSFDDPGFAGRGRYSKKMAPEINITEWRKGAQWFEVNRKLALDIVGDSIFHSKFKQFCRGACYPDEHYFPTMLSVKSPHLLANRSLTWADWSRGGAHPATFGKHDINIELFRRIFTGEICFYNGKPTPVCFLFARKFSHSALEPLLEYATRVFHF